ncbi:MAG: UdgX family uracil-DNA binding protein [Enhydrobacter sp.]|nr:UdgX family uracil-DNA binding protein [Enhydrobacter sp.]
MQIVRMPVQAGADLDGFRRAARRLIAHGVPPEAVEWNAGTETSLFGEAIESYAAAPPLSLPRAAGELIELVVCHRDPERFALLYRLIWRLLHGERALLEVRSDPLVHRLEAMRKSVLRDLHKMHAFLRFRETTDPDGGERFVAWFEPEHDILAATADFFVERFRSMRWSILTPAGSLHWDRESLTFGPPAKKSDAPDSDSFEAAWRRYYESTFNPARANPKAMRQHMATKYWRNLPETEAIPEMLRTAPQRAQEMIARGAALPTKRDPALAVAAMANQEPHSLEELNRLIAASEPLTPGADRAVLGEGPIGADIAFVGEQPGDQEDREGRPFIGPAGRLLDRVLSEVGIDRTQVYVTNSVKHFKYEPRGERRLHKKPNPGEVKRYRWWLLKELELVRPHFVVALGGTALLGLTGKPLSVMKKRGPMKFGAFSGYATVHPSYLLRLPDPAAKQQATEAFRHDLERVAAMVADRSARSS